MLFGSPAIVVAKLLFGWRGLPNVLTATTTKEDVQLLEPEIGNILELDEDFLQRFTQKYQGNSDLVKQVGAVQILRHARGIMHAASRNESQEMTHNLGKIIKPFILKDIGLFKSGA